MSETALVGDRGHRPVVLTSFRDKALMTRGETGRLEALNPEHPNARLIAAAPELLEALKAAEVWVILGRARDPVTTHPRALKNAGRDHDMLRAAIAKAEGRS